MARLARTATMSIKLVCLGFKLEVQVSYRP